MQNPRREIVQLKKKTNVMLLKTTAVNYVADGGGHLQNSNFKFATLLSVVKRRCIILGVTQRSRFRLLLYQMCIQRDRM